MLIRWIIILIVGFFLLRFLRRFLSSPNLPERNPPREIQDEMVQDPVCKVYLPKRQAKVLNSANGIQYYFCSAECREKFIQEAKDRSST
jgi:YHS domain-containing protein